MSRVSIDDVEKAQAATRRRYEAWADTALSLAEAVDFYAEHGREIHATCEDWVADELDRYRRARSTWIEASDYSRAQYVAHRDEEA